MDNQKLFDKFENEVCSLPIEEVDNPREYLEHFTKWIIEKMEDAIERETTERLLDEIIRDVEGKRK